MLDQRDNHSEALAGRRRRYQVALVSEEIRRLAHERDPSEAPLPRHPPAPADDPGAAATGSKDA